MKLKDGVDATGVSPVLFFWLGVLCAEHAIAARMEMVVTCLRRPLGGGAEGSHHEIPKPDDVTAADIRRHYLDARKNAESFCRMIQRKYGKDLGVVLEPEWLTIDQIAERGGIENIDPHIHFQLKRNRWPEVVQ